MTNIRSFVAQDSIKRIFRWNRCGINIRILRPQPFFFKDVSALVQLHS